MKILISGGSGFLGSNIIQNLLNHEHKIMALKRESTVIPPVLKNNTAVIWSDIHQNSIYKQVRDFQPEVLIHAAWNGVASNDRNQWPGQLQNIDYTLRVLELAQQGGIKKVIALGSQAEYGQYSEIIKETAPANPNSAYGCVKASVSKLIETYCSLHGIEWYWLRIFSIFGEGQASNWLIPSVIKNMLDPNLHAMDFTPGEQEYAYLHVKDFAEAVNTVAECQSNQSGIYNMSSTLAISLKKLISLIRDKVAPGFQLHWGKLPYRENQSMLMAGDMTKFIATFKHSKGIVLTEDEFEQRINETIRYYETTK